MNLLGCIATVGAGRFSGVPVLGALVEGKGNSSSGFFLPHFGQDILPTWLPPGRDSLPLIGGSLPRG